MVKCPKCNKEIDYLNNWSSALIKYIFRINKEGYADYERTNSETAGESNDWECPECDEILFYDEQNAIAFLKR